MCDSILAMITSGILFAILGVVNLFVGFLPIASANSGIGTAMASASGYVASINAVFPVSTLLAIVAFILVFDGFWFLYQVIRWAYTKIPGIN
jgi:hypothetical protein